VLAAGALTAAIEWSCQIPAAFVPVIVVAGLLTAAPSEALVAAPAGAQARSPSPFGLGIAIIGIAWASLWAAGILLITDFKLDASRAAASRGDLAAAANDARDAAKVQPWSPEPRLQLGLVDELGGDLMGARSAVGLAIDRAPGDWRPWAVAARIDARAGNLRAAGTELFRAAALSPTPLPNEFTQPVRQEARKESQKAAVPLLGGGGENRD